MSYTSNSFSRQPPSYFDQQESEIQGYNYDTQQLRILIQNEVFKGLLTIKGQIETKIKQIDREIKELKQAIHNIKQENTTTKIIELEQKQFQIVQKVKQILMEKGERDRVPPLVRNQSRRSIDRSGYLNDSRERQSSKDRKPIFNKPEINLSTVLFPFSQNEDPPSVLKEDKQILAKIKYYEMEAEMVQEPNSLIVNDIHESPFEVPLNLSGGKVGKMTMVFEPSQEKVTYVEEQPAVEGLVKNKNKFLKKRSTDDFKKQVQYSSEKQRFGIIQEESVEESMIRR